MAQRSEHRGLKIPVARWYDLSRKSGSGNLAVNGSITAGGNAVQQGLASGSTASGETALFVSPSTVRSLKVGTGVSLSTASNVVKVSATPYVAFQLTGNRLSATVNPTLASSGTVTLAGRSTNTVCTFTFANADPLGVNYMVIATPSAALSTTAFYMCATKVESSTSFSVWRRSSANAIIDGDFFLHTVPQGNRKHLAISHQRRPFSGGQWRTEKVSTGRTGSTLAHLSTKTTRGLSTSRGRRVFGTSGMI